MKITTFLLIISILHVSAEVYSQEGNLSFEAKHVELKDAFKQIENKTGYLFLYNTNDVDESIIIDIDVRNQPIDKVLDEMLKNSGVVYSIRGRHIILKTKPKSAQAGLPALQQGIKITGTVSDNAGQLMPGVNVIIRGTVQGTTTDVNGEFNITVPSDTSVLQFRFIGCKPQEIVVGNRRIVSVTLQEATTDISEVTVVAFGKQKKGSVIGSISTINPSELKVPSSNLTSALAGNMAGVIAYQRSGEPGQDNADFFVRGITTFGTNTNPLILIDGIELTTTDLARLQPDDIASFSIMKDATATALYGARGANGVILVTTKQGTVGPAKVSIRLENSFSMPTQNVKLADPVTYMKLGNEAVLTRNPLDPLPYSEEKIDNTKAGVDPLRYPANDWMGMLLKNYTMNQRANLSVSGGGGVARYYVAASFSKDNGILEVDKRNNFNNNIDNKSYTLRANVNIDVTKTTEMAVRLSGVFDDYSGPLLGGTDVYRMIMHSNPVLFPAYYPADKAHEHLDHIMFGNNLSSMNNNPYAQLVRGYKDKTRSQMLAQMEINQDLKFVTEGLSIRGMLNITRLAQFSVSRSYDPFYYQMSSYDYLTKEYTLSQIVKGTEYLGYTENNNDRVINSTFYFEGMANYARTFAEKHSVSGLLVLQARQVLDANAGSLQLSLPSRNLGLSGRATYSYDNRYFAEFNFGYNGSERFHTSKRFGFFPSAGIAWNLSNEAFWEDIKPIVSNLKLRYSYGLVGNDQIGKKEDRFFYLSEVNMEDTDKRAWFGRELSESMTGVTVKRYANSDITWETSTKQNFAMELGLWNKFTLIAEYFTEYRSNILMERAFVPTTMGLSAPVKANVGEASGRGVDMTLEYQQNWSADFWTSARANFTYASSKYEVFEEPSYAESWRYKAGRSLKQNYGYIAERLFVDDAEAASSPIQEVGTSKYGGGDIKYTDVNKDGRINEVDKVPIGNPTVPEIIYGFGFSMGYKSFDLSAFFQGAANESFWINAAATSPFYKETQLLKAYADDHWSEEKQNVYALWPRLSPDINTNNVPGAYYDTNSQTEKWSDGSTWFMRDGTFLRLKQVEIGYTLPRRFQEKLHLSNFRIYVSGTNLLLFSRFKLWDVEMAGEGLGYPIQRVFNIGLNLSFN